jgi:hypothetical protein
MVGETDSPTYIPLPPGATVRVIVNEIPLPPGCVDVTVTMRDTYGDGWNGNVLYFGEEQISLASGWSGQAIVCIPAGIYSPYCCNGDYVDEVSWDISVGGVTVISNGRANNMCSPTSGSFTVHAGPAPTVAPTVSKTPTSVPTTVPSTSPTVSKSPTTMPTSFPTLAGGGELQTLLLAMIVLMLLNPGFLFCSSWKLCTLFDKQYK